MYINTLYIYIDNRISDNFVRQLLQQFDDSAEKIQNSNVRRIKKTN